MVLGVPDRVIDQIRDLLNTGRNTPRTGRGSRAASRDGAQPHLATPVGSPAPEPDDTYLRFRDALDRDFTHTRRVADYAGRLGYAPRTLSRATLAAAGVGAKEFIDRRFVLEAKRLLAHSDRTAAQIADQLGFANPTQFSKYFQQRTEQSPIAFRAAVRGRAPEPGSASSSRGACGG